MKPIGVTTDEFLKHAPTDPRKAKTTGEAIAQILDNRTWVNEPTSKADAVIYNQRLIMKALAFVIRRLERIK